MKVKELVAALAKYDQEMEIVSSTGDEYANGMGNPDTCIGVVDVADLTTGQIHKAVWIQCSGDGYIDARFYNSNNANHAPEGEDDNAD